MYNYCLIKNIYFSFSLLIYTLPLGFVSIVLPSLLTSTV